jgi:hypothetical protein
MLPDSFSTSFDGHGEGSNGLLLTRTYFHVESFMIVKILGKVLNYSVSVNVRAPFFAHADP